MAQNHVLLHVLVIDDSSTIRRMIVEALERAGHRVDSAPSMDEALASFSAYSRNRADVVITDIFMPGMNGLDGIRVLRERWPNVAVIAISGGAGSESSADTLAAARLVGADAVMQKPFQMDEIVAKAEQVVAERADGAKPKRALVVDDSAVIRKLIGQFLQEANYRVTVVDSVEAAIGSRDIVGVDVVLTDIFMPGIGGIDGIKIFRQHWPDCRIIAMSAGHGEAMSSDMSLQAAMKVGANGILSKPFTKEALFERLKALR